MSQKASSVCFQILNHEPARFKNDIYIDPIFALLNIERP